MVNLACNPYAFIGDASQPDIGVLDHDAIFKEYDIIKRAPLENWLLYKRS